MTECEEIFASGPEHYCTEFKQIRWEIHLCEPDVPRHTSWKKVKFRRDAPPCFVRSNKLPKRCLPSTLLLIALVVTAFPDHPESFKKPTIGFRQYSSVLWFYLCASVNVCALLKLMLKPELHCYNDKRWSLGNDYGTKSPLVLVPT